jgi:peptidyl-prolyl cis-trans isomerase A (cyclophilin A)
MHRSLLVCLAVVCALRMFASRVAADPAPAIEVTANRVEVDHAGSIPTDLLFDPGDAQIKPAARPLLDAIARALAKTPALVRVECHTDDTAPDNDRTGEYSQQRADAVLAYLVKHGVAARQVTAKGFGRDQPVLDNDTDEGKRANRRLEIAIIAEVRPPDSSDLATYTRTIKGKGALIATITTSQGVLHCRLFDDQAPATVANFVGLATGQKPWTDPRTSKTMHNKPFYDGLTFHRVIPGFVIQGGDPLGNGTGGPGYQFNDEIAAELTHEPGTLAMANAGPNTNGSQFFVDEGAPGFLNGHYAIFGKCKEVDVVSRITGVPRGPGDRPQTPVAITRITIARGAL